VWWFIIRSKLSIQVHYRFFKLKCELICVSVNAQTSLSMPILTSRRAANNISVPTRTLNSFFDWIACFYQSLYNSQHEKLIGLLIAMIGEGPDCYHPWCRSSSEHLMLTCYRKSFCLCTWTQPRVSVPGENVAFGGREGGREGNISCH